MNKTDIIKNNAGKKYSKKKLLAALGDMKRVVIFIEMNNRFLRNDYKKIAFIDNDFYAKFSASEMEILAFEEPISQKTIRVKLNDMVNIGIFSRTILNSNAKYGSTYYYKINFDVLDKLII